MPKPEAEPQLALALRRANEAARAGNLKDYERWSRSAERIAAAIERTTPSLASAQAGEDEDHEAASDELRRRLQAYVDAARDISAWERERDAYYAALKAALANNLDPPPPLRPHPSGPLGKDEHLRRIAQDECD